MKHLLILMTLIVAGCASASPIDAIIPARSPSPATTEYLGHLYRTNSVNGLYYSVTDAKITKELVGIRKLELEGLYMAAKGESELYDSMGSALSNGIWGGAMALIGLLGWQLPSPREKAKVIEALHTPVPVDKET